MNPVALRSRRQQRLRSYRKRQLVTLGTLCTLQGKLEQSLAFLGKQLAGRHAALIGMSGSGKSRLLVKLVLDFFLVLLAGCTLIDPHGDCADMVMGCLIRLAEATGDDELLANVHYLRLSYKCVFKYDPFQFPQLKRIPESEREVAWAAYRTARASDVARIFIRGHGASDSFSNTPRLQRWLCNYMTACASEVKGTDKRLTLADMEALFPHHHRHSEVLQLIEPNVRSTIMQDFHMLMANKSLAQAEQFIESMLNRTRAVMGELFQAATSHLHATVPFRDGVLGNHLFLWSLGTNDFVSAETNAAVAGLAINELRSTFRAFKKSERPSHTLFVDEAPVILGQDMISLLREARKLGLGCWFAGQELEAFRRGDIDMLPALLNDTRTTICGQLRNPGDVEELGKLMAYPLLKLDEELMQTQYVQDGHDVVRMVEPSVTMSNGKAKQKGGSRSKGAGTTVGTTEQEGGSLNASEANGETSSIQIGSQHNVSDAETEANSFGRSLANGYNISQNNFGVKGEGASTVETDQTTKSRGMTHSEGHGASVAGAKARTRSRSNATGKSWGFTNSKVRSEQTQVGESWGDSESESEAITLSLKSTLIPRIREEQQPTGRPRIDPDWQIKRVQQALTCLPDRVFVVRTKIQNKEVVFSFKTADVPDPYDDPDELDEKLEAFEAWAMEHRDYLVKPELADKGRDERLDELQKAANPLPDKDASDGSGAFEM